jgi:zinc protease
MNFHVGSYDERVSYTGSAHLLEHLLFKDPLQGSSKNIFQILDKHGATINATTSEDRTNFYSVIPSRVFDAWASAEAARMRYIPFDIDGRDKKEKLVVVDELRMGNDNPFKRLTESVMGVAFDRSGYNHMTSGYIDDVKETTEARLKEFWTNYYGPNNCSMVIVGPMDPEKILKVVHKRFGDIPSRPVTRMNRDEIPQVGPRQVFLYNEKPFTLAQIAFRNIEGMHPDSITLDLIAEIMQFPGVGILEVLKQNHVLPSYNVRNNRNLRRHLFQISAVVGTPEMVNVLQIAIHKWFASISQERLEDSIIDLAKLNLKNKWNKMYAGGVEAIGAAATEAVSMGNVADIFDRHDQLNKVTMRDINRVASYIFQQARETVAVMRPSPGAIIKRPDPKAQAYADSLMQVNCVSENVSTGINNVHDIGASNSPSKILRWKVKFGAIQRLKVPNAQKKTFLISTTAFDQNSSLGDIVCNIIKDGIEKVAVEDSHTAMFKTNTIANTFHTFMIEKNMDFNMYAKKGALHLQIAFDKKHDSSECLQAVAKAIKNIPELSEQDLQMKVKVVAGSWSGQEQDINASAHAILTREMFHDNDINTVTELKTKVKLLQAVTKDSLTNFLDHLFDRDKPFVVTAVTGEEKDVLSNAVSKFHNTFVEGDRDILFVEKVKSNPKQFKTQVIKKKDAGRSDGIVMMGYRVPVSRTDEDFTALRLGMDVLGDGIYSRLNLPLRVKEGLSYGVYSRLRGGHHGSDSYVHVFGSFKVDDLKIAQKKMNSIVNNFIAKGITQEEFLEKQNHLKNSLMVRMDNVMNMYTMHHQTFLNGNAWTVGKIMDNVRNMTVEKVNRAIKKYLLDKPSLTVIAGLPN